jgi:hypothetical protein
MKKLTLKKVVLRKVDSVVPIEEPGSITEGCPIPPPTPTVIGCTFIC